MKRKSLLFVFMICSLSLGGIVQAQQKRDQGDSAGTGRSSSEYYSYMGGKEHYLADSPNYMAGKKHYLQRDPSPTRGKSAKEMKTFPFQKVRWHLARGKNLMIEEELKFK